MDGKLYYSKKEKICLIVIELAKTEEINAAIQRLTEVTGKEKNLIIQKESKSEQFPNGVNVLYVKDVEKKPNDTHDIPLYWQKKIWEWIGVKAG